VADLGLLSIHSDAMVRTLAKDNPKQFMASPMIRHRLVSIARRTPNVEYRRSAVLAWLIRD
jgi:hypothetical protein